MLKIPMAMSWQCLVVFKLCSVEVLQFYEDFRAELAWFAACLHSLLAAVLAKGFL